jgi:hypothetical protein
MYMDAFARLGPWLHIVPLANNGFNRSKSNLAWLEATAAGAVVLAPALEEWQRPGIVNYKDASDFGNKLSRLMDEFNAPGCHPNVTLSRAYIRENLSLRCLNAQRWEILNELWKLRRPSVFACE